jgi:branched-chain amino acid transport system permease protein
MENVIQIIISGVLVGISYAVLAVGLALIFGVMKIVNFAHASFAVLAMYMPAYWFLQWWGVDPFISSAIALPMFFALGYFIQRVVIERVMGKPESENSTLIATMGISFLIDNLILIMWSGLPRIINEPYTTGTWLIGDNILINQAQAYSFVISSIIITGLFLFINKTMMGRAIKAAADNPDSCAYMGINLRFVYALAFAIGIATTASGGCLMATYRSFNPFYGESIVVILFACVVLGGMTSIAGAVLGGILIGLIQQISALLFTISIQNVAIFAIFVLFLYFRPQGILGKKERMI